MNLRSLIVMGFFVLLLAGCSSPPSAIDAFDTYVKDWNEQEFSSMYTQLSQDTQESITKEEFVERYKSIYGDVEVQELKVTFEKPEEEPEPNEEGVVTLPYSVSMQTLAGEVAFENKATLVLTEEEDSEAYKVNWNPSFIFKELNEGEEVAITSEVPTRGNITDRNGVELAVNGTVSQIGVVPEKIEADKEAILSQLSEVLKISVEDIEKELSQGWVQSNSAQFVPIKSVMKTEDDLIEEAKQITGVQVNNKTERIYPLGESTAHLTGYIRNLLKEDLEEYAEKGYSSYERIGVAGLEEIHEEKLHGETGWTIKVKGTEKVIANSPKVDGENIQVTIDSTVQEKLYKELDGKAGTAVALHPTTGETLALTSSPSYNPNDFTLGFDEGEYDALAANKDQPFSAKFNKAYSPGSTIKPLTAAIALKDGLDPNAVEEIDGLNWGADSSWGGYQVTRVKPADPEVTLEEALVHSDNIYFARKALDLGDEKFQKGLKSFLIGTETDFPFPTAKSSVSNDGLGNGILLADSGYGQGELLVSPYHLAMTYTAFANEGKMMKPSLLMGQSSEPMEVVSTDIASIVEKALEKVVLDPDGTAYEPVVEGIRIAGKTGTAELKGAGEETGQENGLFVAYNTDRKDLLIAMMVEDASSKDVIGKVKNVFDQM
ncbi:penicillin-binding transpeptidase domain-containing protein [Guptibacillus algicola]|uniref:penicillin-binding transpeptidase domain-containing protein n=1 Tax=Guptibacillus algicola TaxID=225844 RepID=UPI001CD2DA47|nr:penicillin-binding transpeptidase domain-containing protein [Alkalihalobacillus algicola]MCA0988608.1 penicillin-binding transpeptidase domain-containing protein [Alkalihalobacillus algicola]